MARAAISKAMRGSVLAVCIASGAAACGGHTASDSSDPPGNGGASGTPIGGGGGREQPVAPAEGGSGGLTLFDPSMAGNGGSSSPLSDGCDCQGDGFGARVRLAEGEEELLAFNRPDEARCTSNAPAHAEVTGGCGHDRLSFWLGHDAAGAVPRLTFLGDGVTYVDRAGVTWSGWLEVYPETEANAASVLVGELALVVTSESGEMRTLHVSYKLCTRYLPRALVIC